MSHYVTLPANTYISVKDCERKFAADIAFIHHFQIFQDSMGECSPKAVQGGAGATHFFTSWVTRCSQAFLGASRLWRIRPWKKTCPCQDDDIFDDDLPVEPLEAERTILLDEQVKPRGFRQIIYNSFTPSFCKCILDKKHKDLFIRVWRKIGISQGSRRRARGLWRRDDASRAGYVSWHSNCCLCCRACPELTKGCPKAQVSTFQDALMQIGFIVEAKYRRCQRHSEGWRFQGTCVAWEVRTILFSCDDDFSQTLVPLFQQLVFSICHQQCDCSVNVSELEGLDQLDHWSPMTHINSQHHPGCWSWWVYPAPERALWPRA